MKLRPQSAGWAGPPGLFRVWVPCSERLLLEAGWQEEEELMHRGGGGQKKKSNAMSHFALAAGEGDREKGEKEGREYFCMLYEARHHMPSELAAS